MGYYLYKKQIGLLFKFGPLLFQAHDENGPNRLYFNGLGLRVQVERVQPRSTRQWVGLAWVA